MDIRIRYIAPDDCRRVFEENKAETPENERVWDLDFFEESAQGAPHHLVLAFVGEELAGYGKIYHNTYFDIHFAKIVHLVVWGRFRRRGIGRKLLAELLRIADGLGLKHAKLETRIGNDAALALYRSLGFGTIHELDEYYNDGEDAYLMWRSISE
ncbi:MAG: GNAT family N-acetyltransferase [Defluviitaleaceae bacterium]|nr:GNAT family N-acetyltransferase [Defluviitaleaceae bacterium]